MATEFDSISNTLRVVSYDANAKRQATKSFAGVSVMGTDGNFDPSQLGQVASLGRLWSRLTSATVSKGEVVTTGQLSID